MIVSSLSCLYTSFMFVVLLVHHPLWKFILKPAFLNDNVGESLSINSDINANNQDRFDLTEWQKKIVSVYETTSENYLMKIFVRNKMTVTEFQKKFNSSFPNYERIIQAVEKANYKIAQLIVEHQIPLYYKKKGFLQLYKSDKLIVSPSVDNALPSFVLENGELRYSLQIINQNNVTSIPLVKELKEVILLSNEPCCMALHGRFYLFEHVTYKKIAAFFTKKNIVVSSPNLSTYMNSFVLKTLQSEDISVSGFTVNHLNFHPQPVLTLMGDLNQVAALYLHFQYDDMRVEVDSPLTRLVSLKEKEDDFQFQLIHRDLDAEKQSIEYLKKLGLKEKNKFYYFDHQQTDWSLSIVDFLIKNKSKLKQFVLKQEMGERTYVLEPASVDFSMEEVNIDWFELKGIVCIEGYEIPFPKLRNHILEGCREYQLPNGKYVILPEELFAKYTNLMRMTTDGETLRIRRSLFGLIGDSVAVAKNIRLQLKALEPVPSEIQATLRPYQQLGYSWLVKLYNLNYGGCLADDMGLGKTLQFLSFLQYVYPLEKVEKTKTKWIYETSEPTLFDQPVATETTETEMVVLPSDKLPTLIILPTSLVFNWVNEKQKFAPSLTHFVYAGEKRIKTKNIQKILQHYNLIFTTYGVVRNDIDYLNKCQFECVIMDESQNLKNPSSQIYKAVMQLKAHHYYCLTGTPVENGMMDLWAQMNLVNRDVLGSQNYFHSFFEQPILKEKNEERNALLHQIIKPFILRRTKKEVAKELPDKYTLEVYCEMNEEHKVAYETHKSAIRNTIMDEIYQYGKPKVMTFALSSLIMLREMANQVSLVKEDSVIPSTKVEEILRRLESLKEEGHKVLIFSNFVKFLDVIEAELVKNQYGYSKIIGSTKNRSEQVDQFQNDPNTFCFLISLKAGGVGLNLTAADYVFLIDPWWNPAAEQQAEDRAYRIGQMKNVFVYRFIMKDTIEEKVLLLQNKKRSLADSFINQNNPFDSLDKSEWEDLFK